jgi:hypothetical protein
MSVRRCDSYAAHRSPNLIQRASSCKMFDLGINEASAPPLLVYMIFYLFFGSLQYKFSEAG